MLKWSFQARGTEKDHREGSCSCRDGGYAGGGEIEGVMASKGKSQLGRLKLFCSIWALSKDVTRKCHVELSAELTVTAAGFSCILR